MAGGSGARCTGNPGSTSDPEARFTPRSSRPHSLSKQRASFAEALRRLPTIPGVGPIVAATAIAVFSDVGRFSDGKHAASYTSSRTSLTMTRSPRSRPRWLAPAAN